MGDGGDDNLVTRSNVVGEQTEMQARGPRGDGDRVLGPGALGEGLFELNTDRAMRQDLARQHL